MPTPKEGESQQDFVKRCIPIVIGDKAAKDGEQANAICNSMWEQAQEATQEAKTKAEQDGSHPASHYLVVEDPDKPTTWHLRVKDKSGKLDPGLMGAAWAALTDPKGHRGNRYEGPDKQKAIAKLRSLYKGQDRPVPGEKESVCFDVTLEPRTAEAAEFSGREWDVTIIGESERSPVVAVEGRKFVRSANGRLYPLDVLEESAPSWDGIRVYDNHLTDAEFEERGGMRSVAKEWIGNIVKPRWDKARRALTGIFKVVDRSLAQKLKDAWDQGTLKTVGFSLDAFTTGGQPIVHEGQRLPVVEGFARKFSVDLVAEPAAGGGFNRLIAAEQIIEEVRQPMDEELKNEITELVHSTVAEALAANREQESEAEVEDAEATEAEAEETAQEAETESVEDETEDAAPEADGDSKEALDVVQRQVKTLECQIMLDKAVAAAKLPPELAGVVEAAFSGRIFREAELSEFIKRTKEAQAALDGSGAVGGAGGQRTINVHSAMTGAEEAEMAFLQMAMLSEDFRNLENHPEHFVKERLTPAYHSWVKYKRPRYDNRGLDHWIWELWGGNPLTDRAKEATTTSTVTSIVKNALNVMLANDYSKRQRWYEPIVTIEEVDNINQATLVRVYGLSTLDVVNEGQAYTELTWADEEETAAFVKKGNYAGVTLEALLRDNLQAIRSLPMRLANSWHNTLSSLVSAVWTCNTDTGPVLSTNGALFNSTAVASSGGHANLGSSTLSFTTFAAAQVAMMKQTDQPSGAGQRLLIRPRYLVVPVDLEHTALMIRNSEFYPGSQDNDINPFYQKFDIIVDPHEDDTNNWVCIGDPREFPAIWLIFLRGRRVPELFSAGDESGGSMFTNDTLRYKVRMLTWRFSSTYDCAPVSDFRPVYKANC